MYKLILLFARVDEATLIEKIAADIWKMLNHLTPSRDFDHLIGMGAHMERMEQYLRLDLDEVRMIGIWGPAGIGKTTIARSLFNQVCSRFQNSAFMDDIKGSYPKPCLDEYNAKLQLQNEMLSKMINKKDIMIPHLGVAQERLRDRKVLLVLDDVDRLAQLDALAKNVQWFGPGSRIIITTEDKRLLNAHGINHIYKVDFPSNDEALQMFCLNAFEQKSPKDGFVVLAREITLLVGQLPLGLKVIGSHFRGLPKEQWSMEVPRLRNNLNKDIESILKFSYDALCDEDKDVFLHIACFFNNQNMEIVQEYLVESFTNVKRSLHVLAEKSLISTDYNNIVMHKLLAQLGKEIIRKETREPGQRRFLIDYKDICEVLTGSTTVTSVIGIDSEYQLNITAKSIGMPNLRFLRVRSDYGHPNILPSSGPLNIISPKLRLLHWSNFPMTSWPFINLEFLVELYMGHNKLEKLWDGIILLPNLKRMYLANSKKLKELPDLSTATSLKKLDLYGCSSLVELPSSVSNATNLEELYLNECSSLVKLTSSIGNLTYLKTLHLSGCSRLVELPCSIGNATNLEEIDLSECLSLGELPFSFGDATNLKELDLYGCSSLVELPSTTGNITSLKDFCLKRCSSLVKLPSFIENATNFHKLNLSGCVSLVELPFDIGNMTYLQKLDLRGCSSLVALPSSIGDATSLKILNLGGCSRLVELPSFIGLSSLNQLYLHECSSLKELHSSIGDLTNLEKLYLSGCSRLVEIPSSIGYATNLYKLDVDGCSSLVELPSSIRNATNLEELDLSYCSSLVSLPQLPNSLVFVDAKNCESLEKLDWSSCKLASPLNFQNCCKLNEEARDFIIQRSTIEFAVLPGREVPVCFTYRAPGNFVIVKLNHKPLHTSTKFKACKFKACILLVDKGKDESRKAYVSCSITSKNNPLIVRTSYGSSLYPISTEHLYIFDVEVYNVTSTELVFEFKDCGISDCYSGRKKTWEIKECGILQL
ncbi:unnamed protein product [Arabidopsis thaliana]|uniref:ADP-ribosyl cyclase/cyclic ADP-ribose hydrolase n=1 Tax=Arabidopsis thaliana TaxID=3702 RepID=A0A5S9WQL1_ARATH|nr:unnamed protein product [Arabidopsis thaliana]